MSKLYQTLGVSIPCQAHNKSSNWSNMNSIIELHLDVLFNIQFIWGLLHIWIFAIKVKRHTDTFPDKAYLSFRYAITYYYLQ